MNGYVEIEIKEDDITSEVRYWETTLVMYAMGEYLSMNTVKNYTIKMWNFVKLLEMYYHDDGYFILRFNSHNDMDVVLMKGPYSIRNISPFAISLFPNFHCIYGKQTV